MLPLTRVTHIFHLVYVHVGEFTNCTANIIILWSVVVSTCYSIRAIFFEWCQIYVLIYFVCPIKFTIFGNTLESVMHHPAVAVAECFSVVDYCLVVHSERLVASAIAVPTRIAATDRKFFIACSGSL